MVERKLLPGARLKSLAFRLLISGASPVWLAPSAVGIAGFPIDGALGADCAIAIDPARQIASAAKEVTGAKARLRGDLQFDNEEPRRASNETARVLSSVRPPWLMRH